MKKTTFTVLLVLLGINCMAQKDSDLIKKGKDFNGKELSYVSSETFDNTTINKVNLDRIIELNSIEKIVELLGSPNSIDLEQDKANNGTVLFERKVVRYPGLVLIFPERNGDYKLSRIDLISEESILNVDGEKLAVGVSINSISESFSHKKKGLIEGTIDIYISKSKEEGGLQKSKSSNLQVRQEVIKIKYNSVSKVEKISILTYTI